MACKDVGTASSQPAINVTRSLSASRRDLLWAGSATALCLATAIPTALQAAGSPRFKIVKTRNGLLRGSTSNGNTAFKGIPYGQPTSGTNRFRPPVPARPWRGVRDALELGDQCLQTNPDYPAWLDSSRMSEDCLRLNVWAPANARPDSGLPVMVWLHGGGYTFGSAGAPLYDGGNLARDGKVIVVGINHRLGIFGFTHIADDPDFAGSGNAGMLDIVEALTWVRGNIAVFGGDPGNVTIFGESGGGGKVTSLLGMERARGLFHKAIVQSGSIMALREHEQAVDWTSRIYAALGIAPGNVKALQKVPSADLQACFEKLVTQDGPIGVHPSLWFGPTIDGIVYSGQPWANGRAPASAQHIPLIVGVTLHETVGFIDQSTLPTAFTDRQLAIEAVKYSVLEAVEPLKLQPLVEVVRAEMPDQSPLAQLVRISSEIGFRKMAIRQVECRNRMGGAPVYMYECAWQTPCLGAQWAPHGVEIPFVFNHPHYGTTWDGKDDDTLRAAADPQGHRFRIGRAMMDAWVSFARTGDPSYGLHPWPPYTLESRRTKVFGLNSAVIGDLRGAMRIAAS